MARRNPIGAPSYLTQSGAGLFAPPPPNESAWGRFLRTQIYAPEFAQGNWNILMSVGLFVVSISAVQVCGEAFAPA